MHLTRSDRRRRWLLRWRRLAAPAVNGHPTAFRSPSIRAGNVAALWNQFRRDCRVPDGVRLSLDGSDGCRIELPLSDPYVLIGRGSQCTLRLDDPQLAEVQAALIWVDGRLFLVNVETSECRLWEALSEQRWSCGRWTVTVEGLPGPPAKRPAAAAMPPLPAVEWNNAGSVRQTGLTDPLTFIGSSVVCAVRLLQAGLAPLHAALLRCESAVWLINLAAAGATQVNGRACDFARLDPGDVIQCGRMTAQLTVQWPEAAEPAAALGTQRVRIADLEARLAALRQRLASEEAIEAIQRQLDVLEQFAAQCEQLLDAVPVETPVEA